VGALLKKLSDALLEVSCLSGQFKVMAATPSARLHYIALLGTAGDIIYNGNPASHYHVLATVKLSRQGFQARDCSAAF